MKNIYSKSYFAFIFCAVFTCSISCSKDDSGEIQQEDSINQVDSISKELLQLINKHRASIKKNPLKTNDLATQLADDHTRFMIAQNKLTHENSDVRAQKLFNDEHAVRVAESVANRYDTAQEVLNAWLNSEPHRKNIDDDFTHTGISAIKNSTGTYYYTQIFLTKK